MYKWKALTVRDSARCVEFLHRFYSSFRPNPEKYFRLSEAKRDSVTYSIIDEYRETFRDLAAK